MGIGNIGDGANLRFLVLLITPHGIGNEEIRLRKGAPVVRLITPHGDRKPAGCHTTCRTYGTHYPSWGSETGMIALRIPMKFCSLPLMGIGNQLRPLPSPPCDWSHYPSWGSETMQGQAAIPRRSPHYPSWGSETTEGDAMTFTVTVLITPHGDRKRPPDALRRSGNGRSLPLMGIGNQDCCCGHWQATTLITPHGDRKPGVGDPSHWTSPFSLPLMGIGNVRHSMKATRVSWSSLPLMGIGNLLHLGRAAKHNGPHYPSWGSET